MSPFSGQIRRRAADSGISRRLIVGNQSNQFLRKQKHWLTPTHSHVGGHGDDKGVQMVCHVCVLACKSPHVPLSLPTPSLYLSSLSVQLQLRWSRDFVHTHDYVHTRDYGAHAFSTAHDSLIDHCAPAWSIASSCVCVPLHAVHDRLVCNSPCCTKSSNGLGSCRLTPTAEATSCEAASIQSRLGFQSFQVCVCSEIT